MRTALDLAVRRLDEAELTRDPAEMSEALSGIARCYRAMSAWSAALDYMQHALRWTHAVNGVDQRVGLLCELAELACSAADAAETSDPQASRAARDSARDRSFEAARFAMQASDPQWEIHVLLRISDVLDRCGDHDDAIALQTRAMTLMTRRAAAGGNDAGPTTAWTPTQLM